jgi:hypothetical protein
LDRGVDERNEGEESPPLPVLPRRIHLRNFALRRSALKGAPLGFLGAGGARHVTASLALECGWGGAVPRRDVAIARAEPLFPPPSSGPLPRFSPEISGRCATSWARFRR